MGEKMAGSANTTEAQGRTSAFIARSTSEAAILAIWADVLRHPGLNADENFFDIGGDSLKAMEVVARVSEVLGVDLPLIAFFEDPTVLHLADVADELRHDQAVTPILPAAERREFPLSHAQELFWVLEQQNPGTGIYNTARIFKIRGMVRPAMLERSLNELLRRHEILRVRFVQGTSGLVQVVNPHEPLNLALSDLSAIEGGSRDSTASKLARATVSEPFNLSEGPVMRARLIRLDDKECLLCIALHHAISDGFTGGILLDELGSIYDAFAAGQPSPLPEPDLQFTDYASWEREWMSGPRLEQNLEYWSVALRGAPSTLQIPTDSDRSPESGHLGCQRSVIADDELYRQLQALTQSSGTTLFTVLAAALRILLYRWSGQSDFLLGTIASNRSRRGTERMVGCFVNPLPLRNPVSDELSTLDLLKQETNAVMEAFAHQDCPFARIVEAVNPERTRNDNPLFNVALLLQNFPVIARKGRYFEAEHVSFDPQVALLDLRFILTETPEGLRCDCEYRPDLFRERTIQNVLDAYLRVLAQVATAPEQLVEHIDISEDLRRHGETFRGSHHKRTIAVAANFTAEPIEESLAFWMEQLHIPSRIEFAAYNNVFQELLDPASSMARNRDGVNVVLIRWQDGDASPDYARELAAALRTSAERGCAPLIVCVCPPSVAAQEQMLAAALNGQPGVHLVTPAEILTLYPVENYRDEYGDAVGAVPYTPAFFVALASMVARRAYSIQTAPYKVIVLDCDNTLWNGVCGEDGPMGVQIDAPRRELQEFMIAQREAGMLLCLCSKNAEADVAAVFDTNPGMVLRNNHISASRVNWQPKSRNLKELGQELGLSPDSFILVDDNPLDCAEVRANSPGTLVLELPANPARFPEILRQLWAFDHWNITREDRRRSELYRQERQREQSRGTSLPLEEFLRGLELNIEIRPMRRDDFARAAQLTQRTNQFNCTTVRRTESEIERARDSGIECLVVEVRDRFGDYGLVGLVMLAPQPDALVVDTLLMSCRALGRKVEHRIIARLGSLAMERGLARVDVMFAPTPKNRPALAFLESTGGKFRLSAEGRTSYCFPAEYASRVEELKTSEPELVPREQPNAPVSSSAAHAADLARIATDLGSVEAITGAIQSRSPRITVATGSEKARNTIQETLAAIWSGLLRVNEPGIHDNFFLLGGNSILGVQLISRIRQTFGIEIPLQAVFATPTIAGLSATVESERRARTGLLPVLVRRSVRRSRSGTAPASFAQQRLWFISQLEPGNSLYNIPEMRRIHGVLNVAALEKAIQEILRRHESLRTTFAVVDGQPVQVLASESSAQLSITDLSDIKNGSERVRECTRLAFEEAARPFDLSKGPLIRVVLLRLAQEEHTLILTLHHIVGDRWSLGVLTEELSALYAAFKRDFPSPLPPLPVQYADFSEWQRDWLQGETLQKQTAYWKRQLAGAPPVLELPSDRQRSAAPSHRGAIEAHLLPAELVEKLATIGQAEGATLFMTLLAAFATLLFRYSGQEDIVIGSPVAGRNYTEIEPLIGFFVNTLALRMDLSGDPTFADLVRRIKEVTLNAYAHQDIPFEKLVEELQTERSLSYNPIFQVVFAFQNAPMLPLALPGLAVERIALHPGTALFDLSWFVVPAGKDLILRVEYSTDLFDGSTIQRSLEHFQELISAAAANPGSHISELPLLTTAEQHRLLVEWNDTAATYSSETCAHYLFERQAAKTPDNVAVSFENRSITYFALNERGNQIAHFLRQRGVRPDVCVGIALPRSPEMIAGILGVLKAGGAYLPLDIDHPQERLAYIIGDAKIPIVLTDNHWLDRLPPALPVLCLDRDLPEIESQPRENPAGLNQSGDIAYVIYTSGSTGHPKGVEIEHRGLLNLIAWHRREYRVGADDRATLIASPAFDASVWEIWPYLTAGASVNIPCEETRSSPLELVDWLARENITLTFLPTPMAEAVLDQLKVRAFAGLHLRALLTGGDKLHAGAHPDLPFSLVNHYGPTEDTVVTTFARVTCDPGAVPPIGRPIANTRLYVLDCLMKPVPIGVPGELYIGGAGLARGYRNQPKLTADRFVPDLFDPRPGARLFRTGDRVRYLAGGDLEFLGRLDDQVKLRGFRIELGEIEAVLCHHDAVKECVVLDREDARGSKQLVAYVVSRDGCQLPVAEFRELLQRQLPSYMVPSVFVSVEAFPFTPNGKIDRKALPAPESSAWKPAYVAPRSPMEELVTAVWEDVLKTPGIGVHDNFFELGGHSLLATRVVSRIRESTGADLPLRFIFESPTIAQLVSRIDGTSQSASLPPPLRRVPRDRPLPLSFAQERLWFLDQLEPNHPYYNSPFAVRMNGVLRLEALDLALNEIVRRHDVLRTTFQVEDFHPVQVVAPELRIQLPILDLSTLPRDEQETAAENIAREAAQRIFNLETGPVFRANLLRLGEQRHILLLNFHHIAIDGWSLWQFVQELAVLYEALGDGKPSPLPELAAQYADYAIWHRNWMKGDVLNGLLEYWKRQLDGAPGALELPADRVRPAVLSYNGATARMVCPPRLSDQLKELSRRENCTPFMTLLAAFQTLLFRYSGQEDIVVGSSIANRTQVGVENLIGFFVNALVMRTDMSGDPTFRELLKRVRAMALDAYAHQDLPFEKLVEVLQPDRDLGQTPLFQVCFVLQNAPRTSFQLPGLEISAMDVHNGTTKFDLSLFVVEKPEGLICTAEYSTDLFDASTIHRLLDQYRALLESIARTPDERVTALHLLTPSEEHILAEWNDCSKKYPRHTCLHELFEIQVERTPGNVAVVFEDRQLTYAEVNARSNQLAHRLQRLGVVPETLVGICVDRSLDMVVAILAVLKAGGGYLPLDPSYPRERLALILGDADVPVLITHEALAHSALPDLSADRVRILLIDTDWTSIASEPAGNPPRSARPENVAYVIYTSGSTGKPKGCVVTHANVARLFTGTDHWFGFGPHDTWTLFHSIAFDFSVWEIWGALLYGGKLVVVPLFTARSPEQFHQLLVQHQVSVLNQTPSAFRHLIVADERSGQFDRLALRYVIFGGEALEFRTLLPWIERHGDRPELINMYGITETTVHVTFFKIATSAIGKNTVSLIGRPIPDLQVYILDTERRAVPRGVIGEMYVGGDGVARGYLNREQLTAERFVPDPFQGDPAARLYRTGDLARLLPGGDLQYLGRIDHQLKIRGFRIEPGEIEAALNSHPGVRESTVIAREDQTGDKRLVAYLVPEPGYSGSDQAEEGAFAVEQVFRWTEAFDEAYRRGGDAVEATFNITGWNSSYTGEPINSEEMRVWVETTTARIRSLRPKRVCEIGCGTGLLLFRLAPLSDYYYATDISHTALAFLRSQLRRPELSLPQLFLERRAAHELETERHRGQFTTVVLNSVVQYFPDLDYFMRVLNGALESVSAGGAVFVGDVRSLPLLEAFHTSLQLHNAADSMTLGQLRQRVQTGIRQEGELLLDPEFFLAWARRNPAISHVEIQLRQGRAHNELTLFRYDVILHVGQPIPATNCAWMDWKAQGLTVARLREILKETRPGLLGVTNVANARLCEASAAARILSSDEGSSTIGELRAALRDSAAAGVEPDDLWGIELDLPYKVEIRSSRAAADGHCDVLFRRTELGSLTPYPAAVHFPAETNVVRPWQTYANNPLRQRAAGKLIPQVRVWLEGKIPEYMRPASYVVLDSLPLTGNGKVNRRALPVPEEMRPEVQNAYAAPRTPVEELIAAVFADVLRIDRAGAGDDFFELGGHSLSATQVVSRIRQAFQIELPVRALFESPTVRGLAIIVETIQRGDRGFVPPPIAPVSRAAALPLSIAQQRLWILDQMEPNSPLYNVPRAIRMTGTLNQEALEKALNGIIQRHEVLRTTYRVQNDGPVQVIAPEMRVPFQVVDLGLLPPADREQEAHRIIQKECGKAFDLARDEMIRATLLKLDGQEHILFLNTHHIASDGWSNGVFMRDLSALYQAVLNGTPSPLSELAVQYADYAVWQRNWLRGGILEDNLKYWKARLHGAPPTIEIPTDRPRPSAQSFEGASHVAVLPASLMDAVRTLGRQHEATVFMTLLAAFKILMLYYSKQPDIVVGTDVAGRNDVRTEALIGFFVNLLVLRTDLGGDPSVPELLRRVRETALGAYAHQDAPFDRIVEELRPGRSLAHNPLVQILFVQMSRMHAAAGMPGLDLSPVPMDLPSKFDLAVFAAESAQDTTATWVYSSDLFDAATIQRMAFLYQATLRKMTADPGVRLNVLLRFLAETDQRERETENQEFQKLSLLKLKRTRRRASAEMNAASGV